MADDIRLVLSVDDRDLIRARKEQEKYQFRLAQIEKEYRKGNISAARYNRELSNQAKELAKLGGGYNKANSEIRKYAYSLRSVTDDQLNLAQAMAKSGKGMRRMEILAQQAGYQIGDFAVQVQGGTNAMVALGQQGSQLLGFFGPTGAIAGAALAIATGFIAPFVRAREEVEGLAQITKEKMVELELIRKGFDSQEQLATYEKLKAAQKAQADAQKEYNDALKEGTSPLEDIEASYGYQLEQAKELVRTLEEEASGYSEVNLAIKKAEESARKLTAEAIRLKEIEVLYLNAKEKEVQALVDEQIAMEQRLKQYAIDKAKANIKALQDQADAERKLFDDNIAYEKSESLSAIKELGDAAEDLGARLGISFSQALIFIKAAKAEATVGLDAFGGAGEFKYGTAQTINKLKKGGGGKKTTIEDTIKQFQRQADKEKQLVRLTGQKRREEELFIDLKNANADADIKTSEARLRSIAQEISAMEERNRVIEAARQQQEDLKNTISSSMEDAFMSIIDGTKSVEGAFKDMARQIIAELYRVLVVQKMVKSITTAFGFADGGVFQGGSQVKAFANGGVVGGPTYFPMTGGKTGLMGEAGPEAIMPLKRGKDGKLGVAADGGGGVTINQTFAFQANGDDSVKKIIAQAAPKIAAMTQQQIMDSRRRGGQMKQVFG